MSPPSRPLVTIDDRVTIIQPHRVLLEYVDEVHRELFHTRSNERAYRHDEEGVTWARGHHVPGSEVVDALYAAMSLAPPKPAAAKPAADPPAASTTNRMADLLQEARERMEEAQKAAEKGAPSWWRSRAHR